jgi:short-subunit dehydrogenase
MAVAVITGASAGVGRATARAFAERGYDLALVARGAAGLEATKKEADAAGVRASTFAVDVGEPEALFGVAEEVEADLGPFDVWVNNAFVTVFARAVDIRPDEYRRVTDVSYLGFVYGTLAALGCMQPRDRGVIVQVGSALAYRGIPLQAAYCGAKHAIQGFTESLRCELRNQHSGVRVTMVQLPALNTPQFDWGKARLSRSPQPVPPIYQPEVAADAILFAATHPERRERWVGASTALTLVANAIAPGLLDRYLARKGEASQLTDEPLHAPREGNLWDPGDADRDAGAHGAFDRAAKRSSLQWRLAKLTSAAFASRRRAG